MDKKSKFCICCIKKQTNKKYICEGAQELATILHDRLNTPVAVVTSLLEHSIRAVKRWKLELLQYFFPLEEHTHTFGDSTTVRITQLLHTIQEE